MSNQLPDPRASELAVQLLETMLAEAQAKDLCPHCVGLELIYQVARAIGANMNVDPGELFRELHLGLGDGEIDREAREAGDEEAPEKDWTVH
jgi:hypothetical protein